MVFCVEVYCLYNALSGDSRGLIYTSKIALYIDKENVGDRTIIIITMPIHYACSPPFYVMYVRNVSCLIIY